LVIGKVAQEETTTQIKRHCMSQRLQMKESNIYQMEVHAIVQKWKKTVDDGKDSIGKWA
jgi:hypothetical protein